MLPSSTLGTLIRRRSTGPAAPPDDAVPRRTAVPDPDVATLMFASGLAARPAAENPDTALHPRPLPLSACDSATRSTTDAVVVNAGTVPAAPPPAHATVQ